MEMKITSGAGTTHVPLGSRVDTASRRGGALCTIVPASWAACPAVVDGRIQVLVVGPGGRKGANWWHNGWCGGAGASAVSASVALSYTAALSGSLRLQGSDELGVHGDKLCHEPFDHGHDLGNGGTIAGCGCCQVCDGVHCLLLQLPVVWVCCGVVRGAVGSAGIVSQQEGPLPVCCREK